MTTNPAEQDAHARALAEVVRARPMTVKRWNALPSWLEAHLTNVVNRLGDAYEEVRMLRINLEAAEAKAFNLEMAANAVEAVDHTMGSYDRPGRYDRDYLAILTFDPLTDTKYRWKVSTYRWLEFTSRAHDQGYEDHWVITSSVLDQFPNRSFKKAERAIAYICKVRAHADAVLISQRLSEVASAQSTQIA